MLKTVLRIASLGVLFLSGNPYFLVSRAAAENVSGKSPGAGLYFRPVGKSVEFLGFYDDGGTRKIRFMPDGRFVGTTDNGEHLTAPAGGDDWLLLLTAADISEGST